MSKFLEGWMREGGGGYWHVLPTLKVLRRTFLWNFREYCLRASLHAETIERNKSKFSVRMSTSSREKLRRDQWVPEEALTAHFLHSNLRFQGLKLFDSNIILSFCPPPRWIPSYATRGRPILKTCVKKHKSKRRGRVANWGGGVITPSDK